MARKPHVHVAQDTLLEAVREVGSGELPTIAEAFSLSEATARRKLDGLVSQGKLRVHPGAAGPGYHPRCYEVVPQGPRREVQPGA